jgi:hypothetical protein
MARQMCQSSRRKWRQGCLEAANLADAAVPRVAPQGEERIRYAETDLLSVAYVSLTKEKGWRVADVAQPSVLRLWALPGRDDTPAEASTMRLNSWTTSGAILSHSRLRV